MVVSFVDIRTVLRIMHIYIMFLFSAGLCDYLLLLHTFLAALGEQDSEEEEKVAIGDILKLMEVMTM